jgi:hypothetical protein
MDFLIIAKEIPMKKLYLLSLNMSSILFFLSSLSFNPNLVYMSNKRARARERERRMQMRRNNLKLKQGMYVSLGCDRAKRRSCNSSGCEKDFFGSEKNERKYLLFTCIMCNQLLDEINTQKGSSFEWITAKKTSKREN